MARHKIGVIGGSGFIGTWLVNILLNHNLPVRIIDNKPSETHPERSVLADVRDHEALLRACRGCNVLYNLAAEHRDDVRPRELYHEVNVLGAQNTCAVAERLGIERIVFTSSTAIYGLPKGEADETAPPEPFNDYGRTKVEAEKVFRAWATAAPPRSLTIVRPTVVFGPRNRGNVYVLLQQIMQGRSVVIGDGCNKKSIAYVANVAEFLAYALHFDSGVHVYNYADKPDLDMNVLVALASQTLSRDVRPRRIPYALGLSAGLACDFLAHLTGHKFPISAVRVRKYAANTQVATRRLAETGFTPRHSLRDALIITIHSEFALPSPYCTAPSSSFP